MSTFHRFKPIPFALGFSFLVLGPLAHSTGDHCIPSAKDLVGASSAIAYAQPVAATLRRHEDGMYYLRGEYRILDTARGDFQETFFVEDSCVDAPTTDGGRDGHCPAGSGVVLRGFHPAPDSPKSHIPAQAPLALFLSQPSASPFDGEVVFGDVTSRAFTRCSDGSQSASWERIVALEKTERPSNPFEETPSSTAEDEPGPPEPAEPHTPRRCGRA